MTTSRVDPAGAVGEGSRTYLQRGAGIILGMGGLAVSVFNTITGVAAGHGTLLAVIVGVYVAPILVSAILAVVSAFARGVFWQWLQVAILGLAGLGAGIDAAPGSLTGYILLLLAVFLAFEYRLAGSRQRYLLAGLTLLYAAIKFVSLTVLSDRAPVATMASLAATFLVGGLAWVVLGARIQRLRASLGRSRRGQRELLAEIHHRTKNNLQLISSLLDLDEDRIAGAAPQDAPELIRMRIKALALLHDRLYANLELAMVELERFFGDYLVDIFAQLGVEVRVEVTGSARCPVDHAIRFGLALYELLLPVSRAVLREGRYDATEVRVELADRESITVAVRGASDTAGSESRESIELARAIAERIGGSLSIQAEGWELRAPVTDDLPGLTPDES